MIHRHLLRFTSLSFGHHIAQVFATHVWAFIMLKFVENLKNNRGNDDKIGIENDDLGEFLVYIFIKSRFKNARFGYQYPPPPPLGLHSGL